MTPHHHKVYTRCPREAALNVAGQQGDFLLKGIILSEFRRGMFVVRIYHWIIAAFRENMRDHPNSYILFNIYASASRIY
jgi:hypothetical protein